MKKIAITAVFVIGIVLSPSEVSANKIMYSNEVDNVTISLSDIKEALYGLLNESQKNTKNINFYNKSFLRFKKYSNIINSNEKNDIKKLRKDIKENKKSISQIKLSVESILAELKKEQNQRILYKEEIKKYIMKNKEFLPMEK